MESVYARLVIAQHFLLRPFSALLPEGGALGVRGVFLPGVEIGIAASALLLGLMIFREARPPLYAAALLVGFFAVFHGYAHGTELPHAANPLAYGVGFVIATGLLHASGVTIGLLHRWPSGMRTLRIVGGGISLAGLFLLVHPLRVIRNETSSHQRARFRCGRRSVYHVVSPGSRRCASDEGGRRFLRWHASGIHGICVNLNVAKDDVVASAVNYNGDQLYPRQWNHDFVGIPVLDQTKQKRPRVTASQINQLLGTVKERYSVLFALLAGTGLRIGEALGLKTTDLTDDCTVIHVQRSVWFGQEQIPKTPNAVRLVDIAQPLANLLRTYIEGKSGYLFSTRTGKPLLQHNVLRDLHSGLPENICGLHTFRRFRTAQLRKERVPEDLIKFWLGHARNLTDHYASQLREDVAFRQLWAESAGLGYSIVSNVSRNVVSIDAAKVA